MTSIAKHNDLFYRSLAIVAIAAPMLLVVAAGTLPVDAIPRGVLIVYGLGAELAVVSFALAMRAVYTLGVSQAIRSMRTQEGARFDSVNAFDL